jgi:hypothetical protein
MPIITGTPAKLPGQHYNWYTIKGDKHIAMATADGLLGDRNTFFLTSAGIFGKQSKNLYKAVDMIDGYTHGTVQYTADAKGRKTGTVAAFKFDYQCP